MVIVCIFFFPLLSRLSGFELSILVTWIAFPHFNISNQLSTSFGTHRSNNTIKSLTTDSHRKISKYSEKKNPLAVFKMKFKVYFTFICYFMDCARFFFSLALQLRRIHIEYILNSNREKNTQKMCHNVWLRCHEAIENARCKLWASI